jgi:hypothetical protein
MRAPLPFIQEGCCRLASEFNVPNGIGEEEVLERFCKDIFSTLDSLAKKAEMKLGFHDGWMSNLLGWIGK